MASFDRNKDHNMAKQTNLVPSNQINMIGEGTVFEGTLKAKSDVRVSGRIVGKLQVEGKVFITQDGFIEGEVVTTNADVAGNIQGDIHVAERLVLKSSGHVEGSIKTARLVVEEGASFNGECTMGEGKSSRSGVLESAGIKGPTNIRKAAQ